MPYTPLEGSNTAQNLNTLTNKNKIHSYLQSEKQKIYKLSELLYSMRKQLMLPC